MDIRIAIAVALMAGTAAQAAEPPVSAKSSKTQSAALAPATPRAPLKLGIGDVRKYMMPNEFQAAIQTPDADRTTVVVQGEREPPPLKSEQPVPVGIMTPFWMIAHPLNAWRALVPDPRAPPPGPPDVVPPRVFRWGP
jgi:hypothetical protein